MQFIGAASVAYAKLPSEFLETTPLEDLVFLYRLYTVQPFGYRRDEFNTGLVCSTVFNSQRVKRSDKVWAPSDFMPLLRAEDTGDIDEHNLQVMQALCRRSQKQASSSVERPKS